MKDIEKDVYKRTINSKNLDDWVNKLGVYTNTNVFTTGGLYNPQIVKLLENVMSQAKFKGLARGGTAELVKGVISENTMHYVTRMGDDMKNNLRQVLMDAYENKTPVGQRAGLLQKEVKTLSNTRAKLIARTETMRASNMSNYVNAKLNMGAKSYKVISASDCCERCEEIYKNGAVWFDIEDIDYFPPLHPNCRCVASYSTKTAYEQNIKFYNKLDKNYPLNKNMDQKTINQIRGYSENGTAINNALQSENINKFTKRDYEIGQNINNNILNNGHSLKNKSTLWRGQDELYISNPEIGKEFSWNRLTSTSFRREKGVEFKNDGWLVEIVAPKNTKGLYIENISTSALEHEYLLAMNTKYKIINIMNNDKYIKLQIIP